MLRSRLDIHGLLMVVIRFWFFRNFLVRRSKKTEGRYPRLWQCRGAGGTG